MVKSMKKILIVEDERPMAKALELKLNNTAGFEAKAVFNGEEALQILENEKYDLVLTDLIMPKMDGFGLLEALKKKKIKIPVIISSNLSQPEDLKKTKDLGAKDYFIKSDTPISEVIKNIERVLKR